MPRVNFERAFAAEAAHDSVPHRVLMALERVALTLLLLSAPALSFAQQTGAKPQRVPGAARTTQAAKPDQNHQGQLPALSYVCPMSRDADVVENKPGKCPKCGMTLAPVRLDTAWSCPVHSNVIQDKPGLCPIDKRQLVQITASVYFGCSSSPNVHELSPGKCGDGQDRIKEFERRPHGDHNPRHGGQFFMAEDNWHHLEGAYPRARLFRAFFYNDFTQPIPAKGFSGRVAVLDSADKEVASFPLRPGGVRTALDARIASPKFPLKLKMWVKFAPTDKEHTFDFSFASLTKEPVAPLVTKMTDETPTSAAPTGTTPVTSAEISAGPPAAALPGSPQSASKLQTIAQPPGAVQPVPGARAAPQGTAAELVAELVKKSEEVQSLLDQGNLGALWFQAIGAKDIALVLEEHQSELSDRQRLTASMATKRLVEAAWQIDAYGDLGDRQKLIPAYSHFAAAVADIKSAYASAQ
jgi:hypothetical protein